MDQEKITKSIKENKGILRQLTDLNNEIKDLKSRVKKLEKNHKDFESSIRIFGRKGIDIIPGLDMTEKEISEIKVGGTDPD